MVKEWKFCCTQFRFVLWSNKLTCFWLFNFLAISRTAKKKILFLVFLQVIHIKLSSFSWYFFIFGRSLFYWTLNKWSLETWSCACCYCTYGLLLCFQSLWNISKKRQQIWGGSRTNWCRSQWVNGHLMLKVNLPIVDTIHSKDNKFVTGVNRVSKKHWPPTDPLTNPPTDPL